MGWKHEKIVLPLELHNFICERLRKQKNKRKEIIRIAVTDGLVILNWTAREYVNSKAMIHLPVAIVVKQRMYFCQETEELFSSDSDEKNTFYSSWPLSRTQTLSPSSVYNGMH